MEIMFFPVARVELADAISYYNSQSEGLGYEFAAEVNLSSARYVGLKLDTTWGPRYDWDKATAESYKKWEEQKQNKEFSFPNPLLPGTWNKVELILPATKARQVGFIELSITTSCQCVCMNGEVSMPQ